MTPLELWHFALVLFQEGKQSAARVLMEEVLARDPRDPGFAVRLAFNQGLYWVDVRSLPGGSMPRHSWFNGEYAPGAILADTRVQDYLKNMNVPAAKRGYDSHYKRLCEDSNGRFRLCYDFGAPETRETLQIAKPILH